MARVHDGLPVFRRILLWPALLLLCGLTAATQPAAQTTPLGETERVALVVHLDGAIGPATADFFADALETARERNVEIVVLQLDTPGGLDTSMRDIIRGIIASPVPVATYVAPGGARAASAGAFILYASHVAAMAPGTNVGAATPVAIGGLPGAPGSEPPGRERGAEPGSERENQDRPAQAGASEAKAINDAAAYIRALAELRGRNADWAEQAVRQAASLEARNALREGVIDIVADDVDDVLSQADGRTVALGAATRVLNTEGLTLEHVRPGWRHRALAAITNPNVALILMMIGIYGIMFEFMNPGALVPGTIGAISLLIGLYALAVLPISYVGLGLILLGVALMVAEGFAPSFGVLGVGGAAAFVFGAMILVDTEAPGFAISLPVIASVGVASLAFSLLVVRMALGARRQAVSSGREQMIGARAVVQDWKGGSGHVQVNGERWNACAAEPLRARQPVRIVAIDGLTLTVAPYPPGP